MAETSQSQNARVIRRFLEILETRDFDALDDVCTQDVVQEMPQSGERVRGLENVRAVFTNYPGGTGSPAYQDLRIRGDEPKHVMTPTFNVIRVAGLGEEPVAVWMSRYPDGSEWWIVSLLTMRDDKIAKQTVYFAPTLPAPEWRARWVEKTGT